MYKGARIWRVISRSPYACNIWTQTWIKLQNSKSETEVWPLIGLCPHNEKSQELRSGKQFLSGIIVRGQWVIWGTPRLRHTPGLAEWSPLVKKAAKNQKPWAKCWGWDLQGTAMSSYHPAPSYSTTLEDKHTIDTILPLLAGNSVPEPPGSSLKYPHCTLYRLFFLEMKPASLLLNTLLDSTCQSGVPTDGLRNSPDSWLFPLNFLPSAKISPTITKPKPNLTSSSIPHHEIPCLVITHFLSTLD